MILQALKDYYDRKAADPDSGIAPEGWEWKEIPFVVVLNPDGTLHQIEDTRENDGKRQRGKMFLVPHSVKRTVGISANLLWDVASYALGVVDAGKIEAGPLNKLTERVAEQRNSFLRRIEEELPDTPRTKALKVFLASVNDKILGKTPQWEDIQYGNPNISFRFSDRRELFCRWTQISRVIDAKTAGRKPDGVCLVSGEPDIIAELHHPIKNVQGAQSTGANIVSFNLASFRSYGKGQGYNAPVGEAAMFAYTTAINTLLSKDSRQRLQVGDASVVCWSAEPTRFEEDFAALFSEPRKDDPDAGALCVKHLFESPANGTYREDTGVEKFFVLGLSPNAGRISVRFWQVGTVAEIAGKIRRHFEDLGIVKPPNEPAHYSIWRLLVNIATLDKSENIPPNVAGDFMRSILEDRPYPQSLLQAALRRIKSDTEHRVKPVRAALIKGYLNRYLRAYPRPGEKELTMALDTEQPSVGYQLGRLFAALEKIQEEANPGLNATIRERYYGAACSSPVTVFGTLLRLKNHHVAKLENKGRAVNLERLLGEIVGRIGDFPPHLNLHEQGRFAIGYYHQRQDFFTKKDRE